MNLRELKKWLDTKSESELDKEIVVSDRMWADDERDVYPILRIGYQGTSTYRGYVLLVSSQEIIDLYDEMAQLKGENYRLKKELGGNDD